MFLTKARTTVVGISIVLGVGCSGDQQGSISRPSSGGGTSAPTVSASDLAFCVAETNRYRARVGAAAVSQSSEIEAFALAAARSDHETGVAHGYTNLNRPQGAFGENEAPRWPHNGSIQGLISSTLAAFWAEGPGGGHYENMREPLWGRVGCGIFVSGAQATLVQHFRP